MSKLKLDVDTNELDEMLEKREAEKAKEEAPEEAVVEETSIAPDGFDEALYTFLEGEGVDREDIAHAKNKFGKLYVFPWTDDKIYIFRALYRKEWNKIRALAAGDDSVDMQFLVIKQACIFPVFNSVTKLEEEIAGLQDTLSELIMRASGFIAIEQALATLREL